MSIHPQCNTLQDINISINNKSIPIKSLMKPKSQFKFRNSVQPLKQKNKILINQNNLLYRRDSLVKNNIINRQQQQSLSSLTSKQQFNFLINPKDNSIKQQFSCNIKQKQDYKNKLKKQKINKQNNIQQDFNSSEPINKNQYKQQQQQQQQQQKQHSIIKQQIFTKHYICNRIRSILQKISFQIFITFLTLCSLFMQDMRTIFIENEDDYIIDFVNLLFLGTFLIQILMSLTIDNYAFSFFFYLDIISTLSIFMDVSLLTDLIYNVRGSSQQLSIIVSQSKASRAAARAVRIMKIFRLARVVKLYKAALKTKQLNEYKQKQLKSRIKNRKKKLNSTQMNINFENQTSQYNKFSFKNNTSTKHKQKIQIQKSDSNSFQGNPFLNTSQKISESIINISHRKSQIKHIDKIRQQINEQDSSKQNQSNNSLSIIYTQKQQANKDIGFKSSLELSKKQSNISKILTDSTIKKIIIVILVIMFSMTVMDINNYYPENSSWDFLAEYVSKLLEQPQISIQYINKIIQKNLHSYQDLQAYYQVISVYTPFKQLYSTNGTNYNLYRITQIGISQTQLNVQKILQCRPYLKLQSPINNTRAYSQQNSITFVLSYKDYNKIDSLFSICKIIFICVTILYLLQSFNSNITNLIVTPIQNMLEIIINSQQTLKQDQQEQTDFKQARYQTRIVQKAILKIRGLMSTIFGKIGMDLLYKQLFKADNISAKNYLDVKKKSNSIYGICRIQNFVQISQTLQNDTFTFVNQIANIVHTAAYRYGGYGVKNLSDGFLVVFNLPQGRQKQLIQQTMKSKHAKQVKNQYLNVLCDYSIYSFVKTLVKLHKQPKLLKYKKDQRILQKFGNKFQIEMNFGICFGQSIQGIVGSQFKIDPVYLGGKLDQLNKISIVAQKYPNLIILDKQLYDKLTIGLQRHCRKFDLVKLNQYDQGKTQLYVVDLDLQYISPSRSKAQKYKRLQDVPDIHLKKQLNMEYLKDSIQIDNYSALDFISSKKQLREVLRKKFSQQMKKKYQMAFYAYSHGQWADAKSLLQDVLKVSRDDILSKRIYSYMARRNFCYSEIKDKYKQVHDL